MCEVTPTIPTWSENEKGLCIQICKWNSYVTYAIGSSLQAHKLNEFLLNMNSINSHKQPSKLST